MKTCMKSEEKVETSGDDQHPTLTRSTSKISVEFGGTLSSMVKESTQNLDMSLLCTN